ncbi:MAG: hypothetical protein IJ125_06780, partial [Atopobiaceae bacterium]|nr:hypothetical protein [Atopobiaceae bacterium]
MSILDEHDDQSRPLHMQNVPSSALKTHERNRSEQEEKLERELARATEAEQNIGADEDYSLNDDRRVKTLSPGALVRKRFFRNRVAMVGLVSLVFMFVFSFICGLVSP